MAAPVLQFKRGLLANLPGLRAGEPGFTTDSYDLYVGIDSTTSNNKFFGSHRYWTRGTASTGSGVNFVEGTTNGTSYITLKAADSLAGVTTFTLPAADGTNGQILTTNGSGVLSFSSPAASSFTIAGDSGSDTFNTGETLTFAGTAKEINTTVTNNQVQIGLPDDVIIANNFKVSGISTFVGAVTFEGGTITLGDAASDNVVFAADVNSNIIPNTDATYDFGTGSQRWKNANFSGIVTATTFSGALSGNASSADQVKTVTASDNNANYYVTFVDANNGSATNETVYTDDGIYYNPGTNTLTTQQGTFTGNVIVAGTLTGTASTATRATTVDTTSTSTNADYYVPFVDTLAGQTGETVRVGLGLSVNPSTGEVKTGGVLSVGNAGALTSYIKAGGGSNAMYIYSNGNIAFQGTIGASQLNSGGGNTVLTLSGTDGTFASHIKVTGITTTGTLVLNGTPGIAITAISSSTTLAENSNAYLPTQAAVKAYVDAVDVTTGIAGDTGTGTVSTSQTLTVAGTAGEIETSASSQTITVGLPDTVIVGTALSAPTLKTATLQHRNGTQAATIDTSGNITASQNLTVTGNLYVNGSTTQVNTTSVTVEDRTLELGLVDGSAPGSTTTWDLGVLFNYYDGSAKKSALVWEQSDARFKLGSVISAGADGSGTSDPQITFSNYAALEIGSLWVNDCAGQSQVINCSGTTRTLENITIDAGTF